MNKICIIYEYMEMVLWIKNILNVPKHLIRGNTTKNIKKIIINKLRFH